MSSYAKARSATIRAVFEDEPDQFDPYKIAAKTQSPFEQDGRWQFHARNTLPPPPPFENIEKKYVCGKGSFIDWDAQYRAEMWGSDDK